MSRKIKDEELVDVNGGADVVTDLEQEQVEQPPLPNRNRFCKCPPGATGDSTTIEYEPKPEGDHSTDLS